MATESEDRDDPATPLNGQATDMLADPVAAAQAARKVLSTKPDSRPALQLLAGAMRRLGELEAAERAEVEALRLSLQEPSIRSASAALAAGRAGEAERDLRDHLRAHPNDAAALRLLADVAARAQRPADAERLLGRALELVPAFTTARKELAILLDKEGRPDDAVAVIDARLADHPRSPDLLYLKATLLARSRRPDEAIAANAQALAERDNSPVLWLAQGRFLAAVGRKAEAVLAYRTAVRIDPGFGTGWWGIADTDVSALNDEDIAAMRAAVAAGIADPALRIALELALGRAFEAKGEGEPAFRHYAEGHALRRQHAPYDPDVLTRFVDDHGPLLSPQFFADRAGHGERTPGPIFVVGMHRAGSTLVEQILSSHPAVEGLAELHHIPQIARRLGGADAVAAGPRYLEALRTMPEEAARALGATYLEQTGKLRRTAQPLFVDKMPGNWLLVPLIRLILPAATIIDVRRDPLDCCISNFCRYYAAGQEQADDLHDLGRYYRDYVRFMDRVDHALPDQVVRLTYERLVDDTEAEVRRLLDACGLPFDERCLRFFETERAVRTPSAQQVRRPVNRDGIGRWRPFAPWLQPLTDGLGIELPGT